MAGVVTLPVSSPMLYADARFEIITATRDTSAATSNVSYTGLGFTPKAILAFGSRAGTVANAIGFAENTGTAEATEWYSSGGAGFYSIGTNLLILIEAGGVNYTNIAVASYDTDGFTATITKAGSPTGTADLSFACFR